MGNGALTSILSLPHSPFPIHYSPLTVRRMPPQPPTSQRILVVDDDDTVRSALARYLAKTGYDTLQANGGEEALVLLAHGHFDELATSSSVELPASSPSEVRARTAISPYQADAVANRALYHCSMGAPLPLKPVDLRNCRMPSVRSAPSRSEIELRGMEQGCREVAKTPAQRASRHANVSLSS